MHRGRVQSQGGQFEDSESWNEPKPIKAKMAHKLTKILEAKQPRREKTLRWDAFNRSRNFISKAESKGGVAAQVSKTYMVKNDAHRRVDLEVRKGEAFIP